MLVVFFVIIECFLSIRSASLGLATYLGLRLCLPPAVRFAGVSANTLFLLVYLLCLLVFHFKLLGTIPRIFIKHGICVLFLFLSLFVLSFFAEFVPRDYQHKELFQFFFTEMIPFLLIPLVIKNEKDYRTLLYILALASLFNVTYGLFTYAFNANPLVDFFGDSIEGIDSDLALSEEGRFGLKSKAVGIYSDKIFMALVSLLIFTFFFGKDSLVNKKIIMAILVMSFITCFFTTQRTALFCLVLFCIVDLGFGRIKLLIKQHAILFLLLTVVILASPPFKPVRDFFYSSFFIFSDTKQEQIVTGGSSVSVRLIQAQGAILIAGSDIWQGLGYGFASYREGTNLDFNELYGLESYLLKIGVNSGILGIVAWLLFFLYLVRSSVSNNTLHNKKYIIAFNLSYLLAIIMTDISGSFFLYLVFLELNCNKNYLKSQVSQIYVNNYK